MKKNKINPKVNSVETFIKYYLPKYYKKKQEEEKHKCWYCMTDAEKNDWLKSEGFSMRYPFDMTLPETNFYVNGMLVESVIDMEREMYLARIHNPRELIPLGF